MTTEIRPATRITHVHCPVRWTCPVCRRTVPAGESHPHLVRVLTGRAALTALPRLATDPTVAAFDLVAPERGVRKVLLVWSANPARSRVGGRQTGVRRTTALPSITAVERLPKELAELGFVPGKDALDRWLGVALANGLTLGDSKTPSAVAWADAIVRAYPEGRELSQRFAGVFPKHQVQERHAPGALRAALASLRLSGPGPVSLDEVHRWFGPAVAAGIAVAREPDLASTLACRDLGLLTNPQRFLGQRIRWLAANPQYRRLPALGQAIAFRLPNTPRERGMEVFWFQGICRHYRGITSSRDLTFWAVEGFSTGKATGESGGNVVDVLLREQDEKGIRGVFELLRQELGLEPSEWTNTNVTLATARWLAANSSDNDPGADRGLRDLFRTAAGFDFAFWMGLASALTRRRHPAAFVSEWN